MEMGVLKLWFGKIRWHRFDLTRNSFYLYFEIIRILINIVGGIFKVCLWTPLHTFSEEKGRFCIYIYSGKKVSLKYILVAALFEKIRGFEN